LKTPFKNLRIYMTHGLAKAYPLTLHGPIQFRESVPLKLKIVKFLQTKKRRKNRRRIMRMQDVVVKVTKMS
jgi:hypothetical protein